jgi:hypothetical protein
VGPENGPAFWDRFLQRKRGVGSIFDDFFGLLSWVVSTGQARPILTDLGRRRSFWAGLVQYLQTTASGATGWRLCVLLVLPSLGRFVCSSLGLLQALACVLSATPLRYSSIKPKRPLQRVQGSLLEGTRSCNSGLGRVGGGPRFDVVHVLGCSLSVVLCGPFTDALLLKARACVCAAGNFG